VLYVGYQMDACCDVRVCMSICWHHVLTCRVSIVYRVAECVICVCRVAENIRERCI